MSKQWQYHVRIDLADEPAAAARRDPADPALAPPCQISLDHQISPYVDGAEVCGKDTTHAFEADLQLLHGGKLVMRLANPTPILTTTRNLWRATCLEPFAVRRSRHTNFGPIIE
jgi:hypothetical protein